MKKWKKYKGVKFSSRIFRQAVEACRTAATDRTTERIDNSFVTVGAETWRFDSLDDFLSSSADKNVNDATIEIYWDTVSINLGSKLSFEGTEIGVSSDSRTFIQTVFSFFEEAPPDEKIALPEMRRRPPRIFIGHGGDAQWERLKSHLQDQHKLEIVAYETGARAGHVIRDILDSMLNQSSFALLVLTGEDKTESGVRARQNVIHECGLFQGRLGFDRAILIVERGVELASNFDGIQQLRFDTGRISEVFGDVIATLRREFGPI
jgi:hypothetical protein